MSCLVTNAGDSSLYVFFEEANKRIRVIAVFDQWEMKNQRIARIHDADSYKKLAASEEMAQFLISVPFECANNGATLEYILPALLEDSARYKQNIINSIKKGNSLSKYYGITPVKMSDGLIKTGGWLITIEA